ncbi:MAG: hypothetical protein NPIRA04_27990 [Nitrospirales bacterium]|nr:MAG: hypothetical protein NPIRA04_27990 [Nitrospirales bacterium]
MRDTDKLIISLTTRGPRGRVWWMPRQGRLPIIGGCYHVMGRGLERRQILKTPDDKEDLLARLAIGLEATRSHCLAWAILPNHYHLLLRVGAIPLSHLMHQVLRGYTTFYNRRHHRWATCFKIGINPFSVTKTPICSGYRYIHLNPVEAKLVQTLRELDEKGASYLFHNTCSIDSAMPRPHRIEYDHAI